MIGIIGAMELEVTRLTAAMADPQTKKVAGMTFYKGKISGCEVVVVRSGVGKVNAAVCTQILVDHYSVDSIINTGIAGGVGRDVKIGDVVLSTDTVHHDVDAVGFGYPVGVIPQMEISTFVADKEMLAIAKAAYESIPSTDTLHIGRILTGDQFISDAAKRSWLLDTFDGLCCEMEGAAIAHTAHLNDLPFLIIRTISDNSDADSVSDYPAFEKAAAERSAALVEDILARISAK